MSEHSVAQIAAVLIGASVFGTIVGVGSTMTTMPERKEVASAVSDVAVAAGMKRAREPQPGDHWGGCNDARAAGTAPIYRDEPGYRENMDGDGDGIACEPIR
ncbi:Excalibur calcium-binding domain-containing protein [Sphingomonas palmae]|uniref:Excalibur calcium-binding domain-containing protein n=1 Tax=Sphingomonas palmae TaxID=1855283 RepID=A0A1H7Q1N9_9SPHN|nr:excalibur calcium-binding domain-containing protein [Sphingomonas palmae]SEL41624.1 Excalibur calcium-binding domain-containing protein [Sphingomonas palmae]